MEVVKDTFNQSKSHIEASIANADFIAVDLEFTGVKSDIKLFPFDSSQKRYEKLKTSVSNYIITQMGVCTFHWDGTRCIARPFNIWVFPRAFDGHESPFKAQPSSLTFLRENHFDFNKWIDEGVSFLSQKQVMEMKKAMKERKERIKSIDLTLNKDDKEFIERVFDIIQKWRDEDPDLLKPLNLPSEMTFNSYLRLVIHQEVPKKFPDLYTEHQDRTFIVRKIRVSREEEERLKNEEKLQSLQDAIGVGHVVDWLVKYKKPLLGHNMMLDLMQIYHSFIGPLPLDVVDYKSEILKMFPTILDTKTIALTHQITEKESFVKSTALGDLYTTVSRHPKKHKIQIQLDKDFDRYSLAGFENEGSQEPAILTNCHEAGFDALLTGACFVHLGMLLENGNGFRTILPNNDIFAYELNKTSLSKNTFDFTQQDEIESRKMFFYFEGLEKGYNNRDITCFFDKIGRARFHRVDETCGVLEFMEGQMTENMETEIMSTKKWKIQRMVDVDRKEREELLKLKEKIHEKSTSDKYSKPSTPRTPKAESVITPETNKKRKRNNSPLETTNINKKVNPCH